MRRRLIVLAVADDGIAAMTPGSGGVLPGSACTVTLEKSQGTGPAEWTRAV